MDPEHFGKSLAMAFSWILGGAFGGIFLEMLRLDIEVYSGPFLAFFLILFVLAFGSALFTVAIDPEITTSETTMADLEEQIEELEAQISEEHQLDSPQVEDDEGRGEEVLETADR